LGVGAGLLPDELHALICGPGWRERQMRSVEISDRGFEFAGECDLWPISDRGVGQLR
jgi:hypothetical protein